MCKVLTKLDDKSGYWSVPLSVKSHLLTFRTTFGRYCWLRLPFGHWGSQDVFQARMDGVLEGLDSVMNISDDIVVAGTSAEDHDCKLASLMQHAAERKMLFNYDKCEIKQTTITFFGNRYSPAVVQPHPDKVKGIQNMPTPQNKGELQTFLGLMNYLSQFVPHFADKASDLRNLLKDNTPWTWEPNHQQDFEDLKAEIAMEGWLKYYDTSKPLCLEVDASLRGLGATLVQEGQPIAFGSNPWPTLKADTVTLKGRFKPSSRASRCIKPTYMARTSQSWLTINHSRWLLRSPFLPCLPAFSGCSYASRTMDSTSNIAMERICPGRCTQSTPWYWESTQSPRGCHSAWARSHWRWGWQHQLMGIILHGWLHSIK